MLRSCSLTCCCSFFFSSSFFFCSPLFLLFSQFVWKKNFYQDSGEVLIFVVLAFRSFLLPPWLLASALLCMFFIDLFYSELVSILLCMFSVDLFYSGLVSVLLCIFFIDLIYCELVFVLLDMFSIDSLFCELVCFRKYVFPLIYSIAILRLASKF